MGILHGKKRIILLAMTTLMMLIILIISRSLWITFHTSVEKENQIEINIHNCFGNYSSKNAALSDIIENYSKKNSNVRISNTSLPTEKFYTKLLADFSANCGADIIIAPPSYDILQLYKRGFIASISSEFAKDAEWAETFDRNVLRFVTYNDSIYGLPTDVEYILLFCNTEIFKRYGLELPKSYAGFKKVVSALAKTDSIPIAFTPNDTDLYLYQILTAMLGSYDYSSDKDGKLGAEYADAMSYMKELYLLGAFPENYKNLNKDEANNLFLSGSAAMIAAPSSFVNDIVQYTGTDDSDYTKYINRIGVIPFPSGNSLNQTENSFFSTVAYNAGEFTIFISKNAYEKKYDEIMSFVKYLTKPEALRVYLAQTYDIISIKNTENKDYKKPLITNCKIAAESATKYVAMPIDVTYRYIWKNYMCKNIPNIFDGLTDYNDVAEEINRLSAFTDYNKGTEQN